MLGQAFDRFKPHFGQFLLIGLVAALLGFVVPMLVFMVFGGFSMVVAMMGGALQGEPTAILSGVLGAVTGLGLAIIAAILLAPFSFGLQMVAVRDALAGYEVSVGRAFAESKRLWGRIFGFALLAMVTLMGINLIAIIPFLGWLLVLVASIPAGPAILYGFYALVAEDLEAGAAYSRIWQGLGKRLGEHFLAGLVLFGLSLLVGIVLGILAIIPIVGWIAALLLSFVNTAFYMLYMGLRYEHNVKPYLVQDQAAPSQYPQGPTA